MSSRILPAPIVHTLIEIKSIHNLIYNEVKIEYYTDESTLESTYRINVSYST
jgi:hypothetical protein